MLASAPDSTAQAVFYELLSPTAIETRTAGDLFNSKDFGANVWSGRFQVVSDGTSTVPENAESKPQISPWIVSTLGLISEQNASIEKRASGSELKKLKGIVDSAQMAMILMSSAPSSRRPQLNFTDDDTASFGTAVKGFYLHISIEMPGRLTWFADVGGEEHFAEKVAFDGRSLPKELRRILSM
jgi:hypothetical protein